MSCKVARKNVSRKRSRAPCNASPWGGGSLQKFGTFYGSDPPPSIIAKYPDQPKRQTVPPEAGHEYRRTFGTTGGAGAAPLPTGVRLQTPRGRPQLALIPCIHVSPAGQESLTCTTPPRTACSAPLPKGFSHAPQDHSLSRCPPDADGNDLRAALLTPSPPARALA